MNRIVTRQEREQWYREMGWWQDERLESRYERLSSERLNDLAVADNQGGELTHRQLLQAAEALRHELSNHGINKGDRILIMLPNRVEWQIALLAILQLQAIPASIPVTTDTNHLAHAIDLIRSSLVITAAQHGIQEPEVSYAGVIAGTDSRPGLLLWNTVSRINGFTGRAKHNRRWRTRELLTTLLLLQAPPVIPKRCCIAPTRWAP